MNKFSYKDQVRILSEDPRWTGQVGEIKEVPSDVSALYVVQGLTDAVSQKSGDVGGGICFAENSLELVEDAGNAYDHLHLEPGMPAHQCEDGWYWVFLGWRRNTVSHEAVFARTYSEREHYGRWRPLNDPWIYHATTLRTILRKFPTLRVRLKP